MTQLRPLLLAGLVACVVFPTTARAFCGFYVAAEDGPLYSDATQVVLLRSGTTTVLSMQNAYRGPLEDFAMVVPVPVVLDEDRVETLPHDIFARVDQLASPRLVEYWEQDPCAEGTIGLGNLGTIGHGGGGGSGSGYGRGAGGLRVTVEAEFAVGEYDIVILGAEDSSDLETWLRQNGYHIPDGAADVLRPYVTRAMKFFVAKVDASKVTFEEGRAVLSPLRVHYDEEQFQLPIRLGQLSSPGTQDLIIHILANDQRYEVANRPNVTIPTNLQVADSTREDFGGFYDALFSEVREADPNVVVTEYAWQASGCDPCPGPVLSTADLLTFGAALAEESGGEAVMLRPPAVQADGPLNEAVAARFLRRAFGRARQCVGGAAPEGVEVGSIFRIDLTVNADGSLGSVEAVDPPNAAAAQCLVGALRRARFATQDGPTRLQARYPVVTARGRSSYANYVLTRLHYRYGRGDLDSDLVFAEADPIAGGRELLRGGFGLGSTPPEPTPEPTGAQPSSVNNFQGRYIIRHEWEGPIDCENPRRGLWGGPPSGGRPEPAVPPRSVTAGVGGAATNLASLLVTDLPELAIAAAQAPEPVPEAPAAETQPVAPQRSAQGGGCGSCAAGGPASAGWLLALGLWVLARRRRHSWPGL